MTVTVHRVLRDTDLDDLIDLRLNWKPAASPADSAALAAALRDWWETEGQARVGWLARHTDGSAVGMANAAIFTRMPVPGRGSARWAYVANVFVRPECRRAGVGRALMLEVIAWARAEGMVRIVLAPSEASIDFYREVGFRSADDLMRLDLS